MNTAVSLYFWKPLKRLGRMFAFLDKLWVQAAALLLCASCLASVAWTTIAADWLLALSTTAAIVSIVFYTRAYTTKHSARTCWNLIMLGHIFGALFLVLASHGAWNYIAMYGAGVLVAFVAGHVCLRYLEAKGEATALREYHGSIYAFPRLGTLFFIVALVFIAFPISPSFLAQDVLLSSVPMDRVFQVVLFCLAYLLAGVSTIRLYTKVFFGPHKTSHHEIAYKSS